MKLEAICIASSCSSGESSDARDGCVLAVAAGAVALVAYFAHIGVDRSLVWTYGYAGMAALCVICLAAALLAQVRRVWAR